MAELKRRLGYIGVLSLSITALLGTGTFLGAQLGAQAAGADALYAWFILAAGSVAMSLIFAELASMFPSSGGVYEFAKQTYGRTLSFLTGWTSWLMGSFGIVALIVAAIQFTLGEVDPVTTVLIGAVIIVLLNLLAVFGVDASAKIVLFLAATMITAIIAIISPAFGTFDPAILTFQIASVELMFVAVFLLAESFFGWEAATYLADETIEPQRTIPRAIISGSVIVAVVVLAMMIALFSQYSPSQLAGSEAPLAMLAERVYTGLPWIGLAVVIIVGLNLISSAVSAVVTMPRLLMSMARDRLFLHQFGYVSDVTNTPVRATVFQTIVLLVVLLVAVGSYRLVLELLIPLAFIMYLMMVLALPILRIRKPDHPRPFKAPLGIFLSLVLVVGFVLLMGNWLATQPDAPERFLFVATVIGLGLPLYLLVESYYDPRFIIRVNNALFPLLANHYDRSTRDDIFLFLEDLDGKRILEIGSASGRLTEELLIAVGSHGKVIASSFSKREIYRLRRTLESWYRRHPSAGRVMLVHDEEHLQRIPPEVPEIDVIISAGFLSLIQDPDRFISDAGDRLVDGGKIVFVDYINQFGLPDPEFLSDINRLKQMFKKHGFSVNTRIDRGLARDRIILIGAYGIGDIPFI